MTIPNKLKTAFDNKADINHNHDNKYASINDVADVLGDYATKEYVDDAIADVSEPDFTDYALKDHTHDEYINETELAAKNFVSSIGITRIEVVDALPSVEEDGVLYIVK